MESAPGLAVGGEMADSGEHRVERILRGPRLKIVSGGFLLATLLVILNRSVGLGVDSTLLVLVAVAVTLFAEWRIPR